MRGANSASGFVVALGVSLAVHFAMAAYVPVSVEPAGQEASVATDMAADELFSPAPAEETGPAEAEADATHAAAVAAGDLAEEVNSVERASEVALLAEPVGDPLALDSANIEASKDAEFVEAVEEPAEVPDPVADSEAVKVTTSDLIEAVAEPVNATADARLADDAGLAAPAFEQVAVVQAGTTAPDSQALADLKTIAVPKMRPSLPKRKPTVRRAKSRKAKSSRTAQRKKGTASTRKRKKRRATSNRRVTRAGREGGNAKRSGGKRNSARMTSRNSKAVRGYPGKVRGRIARAARKASRAGRGTVRVRFTVQRNGSITGVRVTGGSARLNMAVQRAIARTRAPAIPKEAGRSKWSFTVPVKVQ